MLPLPPPQPVADMDVDLIHAEDPQYVVEYVPDIYQHLEHEEAFLAPCPSYMDRQVHVNAKMRAILVDWLVDVHKKYKLRPETLFLAISLIDRFLEQVVTERKYLQLVGVTALLVASKFEELYPPQIHDFVYVTDKAYTREEVITMEVRMLTALEFKICRPTAVHFLERYQCINGCTEAHRDLAQYLLELSLVEYKMIKYSPSHLAAAAIMLNNKLVRRQPSWTPALVKHTKLTESQLRECAKEMCALLENAEQSHLQAVRKKFSQLKHHSVAKINWTGASAHPPAPPDEARAVNSRRSSTSNRLSASGRRSTGGQTGAAGASNGQPGGSSSNAGAVATGGTSRELAAFQPLQPA